MASKNNDSKKTEENMIIQLSQKRSIKKQRKKIPVTKRQNTIIQTSINKFVLTNVNGLKTFFKRQKGT